MSWPSGLVSGRGFLKGHPPPGRYGPLLGQAAYKPRLKQCFGVPDHEFRDILPGRGWLVVPGSVQAFVVQFLACGG